MSKQFDLAEFDKYREDNRLEVKKAKGGLPVSLWDTYSAFANCYGGAIILGVVENKDKSWRTTGLLSSETEKLIKEFWDTVNNPNKVSANLLKDDDVKTYIENDDLIIVIEVPRAKRTEKPIYINNNLFNGTFRRNGEGDYHCSRKEILGMLRDEAEDTPDMRVINEMPIDVINKETLAAFRSRHTLLRREHVWKDLPDKDYLERIGAIALGEDKQFHPTVAGLLMFGEEYKILREYPEYFLDFREMLDPAIRWTDRLQSMSGDWTGNLFDFFFRIYPKLIKDVKIPFKLMSDGLTRDEDTPVHKAIREALVNCVVNADFHFSRGIIVLKDPDSLTFENPGSIRPGKAQMLKGGLSDPRNKTLLKMFNMIGIGERAGSGVPDIYKVWADEGWEAPVVKEEFGNDRTLLVLSFRKKQAIKTSDKKQAIKTSDKKTTIKTQQHIKNIIEYLNNTGESNISDIAVNIGLSEVRTRAIIAKIESIEALGGNRNRTYRLKN